MRNGIINSYKQYLPVSDDTPIVTLHEGNTPLIKLKNLPEKINCDADIYIKYEGLNPTGSFKDRGMTMAVTKAKEDGAKVVICASTGNTSASAAAYAARAGMTCIVVIPEGKIAMGKLAQALVHGAKIIQIKGNFDDALKIVIKIAETHPVTLVNSVNPYRIQGQKTAAFEIVDELEKAPDYHFIPVGNAGNITAYWMGYKEYKAAGISKQTPKMMGFQAAGSAPIVKGHPIENPETIATAIRIGNPASWKQAEAARDESGGVIEAVSDEDITKAQLMLAETEGVFCEPASAASVAGIIKHQGERGFKKGEVLVATLTGHGLKDPTRAMDIVEYSPVVVSGSIDEVVRVIEGFV